MSEKAKKKTVQAPTNEEQGHALRFLIGAIKANLLEMFYDYDHHSFLTLDEVKNIEDKTNLRLTAPSKILESLSESGWSTGSSGNSYKMWCPCLFQKKVQFETTVNGKTVKVTRDNMKVIQTLQLLFGDGNRKYTDEEKEEANKFINPAFYMAAILVVVRHLNTVLEGNEFRAAYLTRTGLPEDTHFVYRFMGEFVVPKTTAVLSPFDIVTETKARQDTDVECYKRILAETKPITETKARTAEIKRLIAKSECVIYTELSKPNDRDSPLVELVRHQFILTNNWEGSSAMAAVAGKTMAHHLKQHVPRANIILPLSGDNSASIPEIVPPETPPSSTEKMPMSNKKEAPKSDKKPKSSKKPVVEEGSDSDTDKKPKAKRTRKADIKMPNNDANKALDPEMVREANQKKLWADEISSKMVDQLMEYCSTPQRKAKVLQGLNVAAGYSSKTTKRGGNVFNLNTTRLLKEMNNNTGIVNGEFDAAPLFRGAKIRLAVDVKNKKVPITWFKESKIGTNTNLTSNNADLAAWVREQLIPKVWKTFAASFAEDVSAIHGEEEAEEVDEDERIDGVESNEQDENEEPETLFGKKRDFASEMDFISAHAAMLPVISFEGDLSNLGGSLDAQRAHRFNVNKAAMGLDRDELKRLEVVRNRIQDLFKSDTQSVIDTIRRNVKVQLGEPVGPNGLPFEMETPEEVEEAQFIADYRTGVAKQFAVPDFEAEDDEEGEE